jgi:hypothetical protein
MAANPAVWQAGERAIAFAVWAPVEYWATCAG